MRQAKVTFASGLLTRAGSNWALAEHPCDPWFCANAEKRAEQIKTSGIEHRVIFVTLRD